MDNAVLRSLVSHLRESPVARFSSVYYDDSHDTEDAAKRLGLTWRELSERLSDQGAPADTLGALEHAVLRGPFPAGRGGRALIAAGDQVLLDATLTEPPARVTARWSTLPYLVPLIEHAAPAIAHVIARVDKVGADVTGIDRRGHVIDQHTVIGAGHPVHKVETGGSPARGHNSERVEETVKHNVTQVADDVGTLARKLGADLLVVAGEVSGRTAVLKALPERLRGIAVDVEAGGRQSGSGTEALEAQVRKLVGDQERRRTDTVIDRFRAEAGHGEDGRTAQGVDRTCAALREANVEALLIGSTGDETVFTGPDPIEIASDAEHLLALGIGSLEQRRADEVLPFAAVAVGADLFHVSEDLALSQGFGALLRHH